MKRKVVAGIHHPAGEIDPAEDRQLVMIMMKIIDMMMMMRLGLGQANTVADRPTTPPRSEEPNPAPLARIDEKGAPSLRSLGTDQE